MAGRDDSTPSPRRRWRVRPAFLWGAAVVLVVGLAALWLFLPRGVPREAAPESAPTVLEQEAGARAVVLAFPNHDGTGWVQEERHLPGYGGPHLEESLLAVLGALCDGPRLGGAISPMPAGARPLSAFYDDRDGTAIVDFSPELVTAHVGGSAAELATLTAILRTIALNFPEVRTCRILVAGDEIQTLAGNVAMDRPFEPRRWL